MTLRHSLDSTVLESLEKLWALRSGEDYLGQVLSHPSLRDGIMDDRTNVVAVLDKVVERRPELLDVLLDPGQTIVKECSITLLLGFAPEVAVEPKVAGVRVDGFHLQNESMARRRASAFVATCSIWLTPTSSISIS